MTHKHQTLADKPGVLLRAPRCVQRNQQQEGLKKKKKKVEFGVTLQTMWKCTLFNLPEAAEPAGFGFSAPRKQKS